MRITPLAVWGHQLSDEQLAQAAREDAQLTHPNQTCQVSIRTQPRQLPRHIRHHPAFVIIQLSK